MNPRKFLALFICHTVLTLAALPLNVTNSRFFRLWFATP
jgi:hypothetical protein